MDLSIKCFSSLRRLTPALAAVSLVACATVGNTRGTPVQPGQVFAGSYLSVKAPGSEGWHLMELSRTGIVFWKEGTSKIESFVASVHMFDMEPTNTQAEFEELVMTGVRADVSPARHEMKRESFKYTDERGYPCVRYHALYKDKMPHGNDSPLLLALDGLYCRHPKGQNTGFAALYSFRGMGEYSALHLEAENFIQGVQVSE